MSSESSKPKRLLLVVACALVDADGRVLIAQRPEGKQLAGLWEFPGGKVEPGETPEDCLVRELREELGIETKTACLAPLTFASAGAEMGSSEADARLSDATGGCAAYPFPDRSALIATISVNRGLIHS